MCIRHVFAAALLVGLTSLFPGEVVAQPVNADSPPPPALWLSGSADPHWTETFEKLTLATKAGDWASTTKLLLECFAAPPGEMVLLLDAAPWSLQVVGLRGEALRRLENLPPAGRAAYRQVAQPLATVLLLKESVQKTETEILEKTRLVCPDTPAAAEALRELAIRHGEVGHYHLALAVLDQLQRQVPVADWPPELLVETAILYQRAAAATSRPDLRETANALLKQVVARGGQLLTLLDDSKARDAKIVSLPADEWLLFGGNIARAGQGTGGAPVRDPSWTIKTIRNEVTADWIKKVDADLAKRKEPSIPGASPLVITVNFRGEGHPMVFNRSTWGIHGYRLTDGRTMWENPSAWGLDRMFGGTGYDAEKRKYAEHWSEELFKTQRGYLMAENTVTGTLSSDGNLAYMIDDFPMPPPPAVLGRFPEVLATGRVGEALKANTLQAYRLNSGKLVWVLGAWERDGAHTDTYFLSAPLPLDGRLYTLIEKAGNLQLLLLDPHTGHTMARYPLGKMNQSLAKEPLRRIQAAHLAYGDGVIVCPTNAGKVLGVDLLSGDLTWSHTYRRPDEPLPTTAWKVTAPIVVGDKVVFTAPDSAFVTCLRFKDGALLWKVPRAADDVYLGGVAAGKVVIVAKGTLRALNLETGAQVWKLETGMPSGLGAVVGDRYYVPLRDSPAGKPGVAILDLANGHVVVELWRFKDDLVPGNLVFAGGVMVSQSATELQVFPLE